MRGTNNATQGSSSESASPSSHTVTKKGGINIITQRPPILTPYTKRRRRSRGACYWREPEAIMKSQNFHYVAFLSKLTQYAAITTLLVPSFATYVTSMTVKQSLRGVYVILSAYLQKNMTNTLENNIHIRGVCSLKFPIAKSVDQL